MSKILVTTGIASAFTLALSAAACAPAYRTSTVEPAPAPQATGQPNPSVHPARYDHHRSDREIHNAVHRALRRTPGLQSSGIQVVVNNGNVYLSGHVPTTPQRALAHEVAHSVDGVRHVVASDLRVY